MYKTTFAELKTRRFKVKLLVFIRSMYIGFTYHITRNFGCYGD